MSAGTLQSGPAPSHCVMEQAAEWFALLRSGEASAADREQWRQWLAGADEHRQAWHYVEHVGRRFEPLQASPQRETAVRAFGKAAAEGPRRQRRVVLGTLIAAATG
ncbi:FecR/PupR family sigma factor regulator, partial [Bordetella petrii]|uniref:FecR/PupR family sigma factor regulator n=1 Tax=Bordetella petrii TaxID=94624 RepID=UPI001E58397C